MATRMLIDARHPEETRVAVLKGNRIEEFDFESAEHKQIKGNIYLAKVTRVEPSLQAAFVDFGGNRHGFLAFSEIHPDYYQIPQQDRDDLLAEEQAHAEEEAALHAAEEEEDGQEPIVEEIDTSEQDDVATIEDGQVEDDSDDEDDDDDDSDDASDEEGASDEEDGDDSSEDGDEDSNSRNRGRGRGRGGRGRGRRQGRDQSRGRNQGRGRGRSRAKEIDEVRAKRQALRRRYKIQDVIQRRQVLLVQVVKEERGNKGAALTSHLSLAGRYCVLMPNSSHGGGISRKISNGSDRKRLKQIVSDLSLPKSMGLIVRTAGLQRNKTEIKRDFDYLARVWDEIREKTLSSSAPSLVHSDSDLIKRAIRDIYNREIEEVIVEGEIGYKAAKQFMKLLMPSHARRVKSYSDAVPMFQRYGAEDQLSAMYDPVVQLKSGGYLVINPTEALVSIDINSGRSTKEHGIEQTALATNLESAREIARQLRLRDMAGLVVIDFIDMEHNSNVRKVERCMKDALKNDRARIQVGRISGFGLMEMSRQRLRTGVLEATSRECPHCDGTGLVRTASSAGLSALRLIEEEAAKGKGTTISLLASTEAAVYLLNTKRSDLAEIEARYGVNVAVVPGGEDEGAKMGVQSSGPRPTHAPKFEAIVDDEEEEDLPEEQEAEQEQEQEQDFDEGDEPRKKRRRRRGGRGRNRNREDGDSGENSRSDNGESSRSENDADEGSDQERETRGDNDAEGEEDRPKRRRRRGGRGRGRGRGREDGENQNAERAEGDTDNSGSASDGNTSQDVSADSTQDTSAPAEEAKAPKPRARRKKAEKPAVTSEGEGSDTEAPASDSAADEKPKPRTRRKPSKAKVEAEKTEVSTDKGAEEEAKPAAKKRAPRRKKAESSDDADSANANAKSDDGEKPKAKPRAKAKPKASTAKQAASTAKPKAAPKAAAKSDSPKPEASDGSGETAGDDAGGPRRGGWWQRTFGA